MASNRSYGRRSDRMGSRSTDYEANYCITVDCYVHSVWALRSVSSCFVVVKRFFAEAFDSEKDGVTGNMFRDQSHLRSGDFARGNGFGASCNRRNESCIVAHDFSALIR